MQRIFSLQFDRTVNRDNTVTFQNLTLQIEPVCWRGTRADCNGIVHQHLDRTLPSKWTLPPIYSPRESVNSLDCADEGVRPYVGCGDTYFPANSFFTASLTTLPSTRMPAAANLAMAAFMTVPMSFMAGGGVIPAIAARTPAMISSSPAALGR